ncbi:membrane-bound lytic murein transglycosylase MltF [Azovibrio restrictus]|uniref:membrane-bound lytic murein transglycosylase MltF n=1 Tax=Azovibrio restrictus TaxID=146938 RepID=UPI0003F80FC6|nr:membrane-bound lytic murein transglycosylase MltF [Azovibrio restrictus]
MIARLTARFTLGGRLALLGVGLAALVLAGCGRPLPFPTPGQELVVLTHPGPLTYESGAEGEEASGLEHDLVQLFAAELGVAVRFVVVPRHEIRERLARHEGHLAAGWLTPSPDTQFKYSNPYFTSTDVLVRHEAALPIRNLESLEGQTVVASKGSRQYRALQELQGKVPGLKIEAYPSETPLDLLEALARRQVEIVLVDRAILDMGLNFYPMLQPGLEIGAAHPIAWLFPADGNPEVFDRAQAFIAKLTQSPTLTYLRDRYLGHLERLRQMDVVTFINRISALLPKYRAFFKQAQLETEIDWRLLAALSYQESHWDPLNTSPTGVRGMMMLTEETADRLKVSNRLDPRESILAGARYVNLLKSYIPESTPEPDRTWQALAAYNVGPGHFNAARTIAKQVGADPDSWFEMKKVLPLLSRPEYYSRLKSGRARGGEAVVMVENIRMFYDILLRHELPYRPLEDIQEGMGESGNPKGKASPGGTGLKLSKKEIRPAG